MNSKMIYIFNFRISGQTILKTNTYILVKNVTESSLSNFKAQSLIVSDSFKLHIHTYLIPIFIQIASAFLSFQSMQVLLK